MALDSRVDRHGCRRCRRCRVVDAVVVSFEVPDAARRRELQRTLRRQVSDATAVTRHVYLGVMDGIAALCRSHVFGVF